MNEAIKLAINNFAKWLYLKTRKPQPSNWNELFATHKVMKSEHLPADIIMFGSNSYKKLSDWFLDKEITL